MNYTIENIARITGGFVARNDLPADAHFPILSIDSRTIINGENTLFFALKGQRHNGHLYINDLVVRNIKAFVVSEPIRIDHLKKVAIIQVSDSREALQKLTAYHRSRFQYPVIGITGSNGKTIIKEWLYDLLSENFSIVRSPKSYNSQVGVPLSVWNMQKSNNLGIFEAGISKPGEMVNLERIISPTIGVFTNIGDAHQENFSGLEVKVKEKLLLFRAAEKLIFCADHKLVALNSANYCQSMEINPVTWSSKGNPSNIGFNTKKENGETRITAKWNDREFIFKIPFTDDSSIENCCHCFAVLAILGATSGEILSRFSNLAPLAMRLELKKGIQNSLLINDYYNSDINSLEIALSVLNLQSEKNHLRKIVILSDIRQSGHSQGDLYRKVNQMLVNAGIETLIGIGRDMERAAPWFTMNKLFFSTSSDFVSGFRRIGFEHAAILIKGAREFKFEEISSALQQKAHRSVFEVNLNTLVGNLNIFRSLLKPETKIMVMVKAFSYGTGDVEIAKMLQYQRVDYLAVAVADEGIELRNAGITIPVVVMNPEIHSFQHLIDYSLEPNIYTIELAGDFARAVAHNALQGFPVHIKIDTGMNRLGIKSVEEVKQLIAILKQYPQLKVKSAFSHLVASDDPQMDDFTLNQIAKFEKLTQYIQDNLPYKIDRHILNSAGIERFASHQFEMVRLGIGLYGVSSTHLPLKPIGILKSTISQVKVVEPGETIGYNRSGKIERPSEIGIVPLGYADGLDRRLGNGKGFAYINNRKVPITGNICMDMCMIDVTGLNVKSGDEVEFFGEHISIEEIAEAIGTIPYEILTGISQRVKRVYVQE